MNILIYLLCTLFDVFIDTFIMLQKLYFKYILCIKNPEKYHCFHKYIRQKTIFNIDNNKKGYLSTKSAY